MRSDDDHDKQNAEHNKRSHCDRIFAEPSPGVLPVGNGRAVNPVRIFLGVSYYFKFFRC